MPYIFQGLNESQKKAVMTTEVPVLIVAGPGTGKTLTIVHRIGYLISQGVKPENILAVTFTNRAAREMRERIVNFLKYDSEKIFICTLHMLGLKIIKGTLSDNFVIYNRDEQINLLKTLLKDSDMKVQQTGDKISQIKNFLEDMDDEIKGIYEKYQYALSKNSVLDFDDLILKPIEMLDNNSLLEMYRNTFRYIIVDEYQDINPAQYKLLRLLTGTKGNICAVGDSDQAIYAFRGADVENFLNFEKDFKDAKTIILTENYRSTDVILNASSLLIKNNLTRIEKELKATREKGLPITVVSAPDEKLEGETIVKEIEQRIGGTSHYNLYTIKVSSDLQNPSECPYKFSDFAVIFRTNAQAKAMEEAFMVSGIPYQVIGARNLIKRKKLTDFVSHLKTFAGKVTTHDMSINDFLDMALKESDYKEADDDLSLLKEIAALYLNRDSKAIMDFINELTLFTPGDDFDPKADAVTLMTLHMAKGLEFKVVFIAGVEDGLIPYTFRKNNIDIEEERRLFYVGMTRAKDELFLLHARNRFLYGQRLEQSPSPFLREIPEEFLQKRIVPDRIKKERKDKQIGLF